jgi:hypothetical protein
MTETSNTVYVSSPAKTGKFGTRAKLLYALLYFQCLCFICGIGYLIRLYMIGEINGAELFAFTAGCVIGWVLVSPIWAWLQYYMHRD